MDVAAKWTLALSAVSAVAACGAAGYASAALFHVRAASREAHRWRREDIQDRRHERENSVNASAEAELRNARIRARDNLIAALVALIRQVQEEINVAASAGPNSPGVPTLIPILSSRAKAAITIYTALDCPEVDAVNQLADALEAAGDDPAMWLNGAIAAVDALLAISRQETFL